MFRGNWLQSDESSITHDDNSVTYYFPRTYSYWHYLVQGRHKISHVDEAHPHIPRYCDDDEIVIITLTDRDEYTLTFSDHIDPMFMMNPPLRIEGKSILTVKIDGCWLTREELDQKLSLYGLPPFDEFVSGLPGAK